MKLLFICTHNRCRSILGEAIARHVSQQYDQRHDNKNNTLISASAGSAPQGEIHPLTLKYLAEKNISTDNLASQSWHDFERFAPDLVLTMCDNAAKEVCPVWFSDALQVNWALKDPSKDNSNEATQKAAFYHTMDIIEQRIQALLELDTSALNNDQLKSELSRIAAEVC